MPSSRIDARGRVVEPGDQVAERRLARAAAADQGDRSRPARRRGRCRGAPARRCPGSAKLTPSSVIRPATVALRTTAVPGRSAISRGSASRSSTRSKPGQVVLKLGDARGQHGQRLEQHGQVDQEHHQVAEREPAVEHAAGRRRAAGPPRRRAGAGPRATSTIRDPPPGEQLLAGHEVVLADEPGRLAPLAAEGADDPHAAERLGGRRVDLLPLLADVAVERPEPAVPEPVGPVERRAPARARRAGAASRPRPGRPGRRRAGRPPARGCRAC